MMLGTCLPGLYYSTYDHPSNMQGGTCKGFVHMQWLVWLAIAASHNISTYVRIVCHGCVL